MTAVTEDDFLTDSLIDEEERCDLYDLIKTQCAHCKYGTVRPRQMLDAIGMPNLDDYEIVKAFPATWPGECRNCGEKFKAGSWIGSTRAGEIFCAECM